MRYLKYWPVVAIIAAGIIGFFIGRANQKEIVKTKIEYIKGETVVDSIAYPKPYEVVKVVPDVRYLPSKKDTIKLPGEKILIVDNVDTSAIIADYVTENRYRETLFDNDTAGKLIVNTSVQYNKQKSIGYSYTPVYKVVTNTVQKKNTITPFIAASYNTLGYAGAGGGVFIKNLGFEYKYLSNFKNQSGHEGGIKIKF